MANFLNSISENILSTLGLAPEVKSWLTRLREEITLTSPDGNQFIALWRGSPHSITNKLGIHTFPGVVGAKVQDLRSGEEIYNLAILFTGQNNDINASAFMNSLKNNVGDWTIDHPTKGPLFMIWTDATERIDPVESGNITIVESNWIVNTPDSTEETQAQAQAQADFQASIGNDSATDQFTANIKQDTPSKIQAIRNGIGKAITTAKKTLKVVENAVIIDPQLLAIESAINNTLATSFSVIDTSALAGQFQAYIQLFGLGQVSATDSVSMYSDFVREAINDVPAGATDVGETVIAVTEMVVSAGIIGATKGALIGTSIESGIIGIISRPQVITTVQNLSNMFTDITEELDAIQNLYKDRSIDDRYFSQSKAYADMLLSVQKSNHFLLLGLFGLPSEKRITLKADTFVPQIAKNEYGNIGDEINETSNIDLLIASNGLIEDDTYMLEAGREVLIYL